MSGKGRPVNMAQIRAVCIAWEAKTRDGVLPFPPELSELNADDRRTARQLWASDVLGQAVSTFKTLTPFEISYLLDTLNGKGGKITRKLEETAAAAGVRDLQAWLDTLAKSQGFEWVRDTGHTGASRGHVKAAHAVAMPWQTLPVTKQWRLVKLLETRRPGAHGKRKPMKAWEK